MKLGRWCIVAIVLVAVVTVAGLITVVVVPKYQMLSRTQVMLGAVLERYVQTHRRMPAGFHDLESAGLLRVVARKGKTEWQVAAQGLSPTILFYSDDLSVNWDVPVESLAVRNGRLVDVKTGRPTYIIESKRWYVKSSDAVSTRIYDQLRNSRTTTGTP